LYGFYEQSTNAARRSQGQALPPTQMGLVCVPIGGQHAFAPHAAHGHDVHGVAGS